MHAYFVHFFIRSRYYIEETELQKSFSNDSNRLRAELQTTYQISIFDDLVFIFLLFVYNNFFRLNH